MVLPDKPVALSPEQVAELAKKLSTMRHNINNNLALIVAASELIKRKPDMGGKLMDSIGQQPDRIIAEIRAFSEALEIALGIRRENPPTAAS